MQDTIERNELRLAEQDRRDTIRLEWQQVALIIDRWGPVGIGGSKLRSYRIQVERGATQQQRHVANRRERTGVQPRLKGNLQTRVEAQHIVRSSNREIQIPHKTQSGRVTLTF